MSYLCELHAHTAEVSTCGKTPAEELVRLYKEAGYGGVVITDHLTPQYLEDWSCPWDEAVTRYMTGYRTAKEAGEKAGLDIFFGIELRFEANDNDYLVYGADEEFLRANEGLTALDIKTFFEKIQGSGIYVAQAHPFRNRMTVVKPAYLHGVEVFNGNARHDSRNHVAALWASTYNLVGLSGSDFHRIEDFARGGVIFNHRPESGKEVASLLFEQRAYRLTQTQEKGN